MKSKELKNSDELNDSLPTSTDDNPAKGEPSATEKATVKKTPQKKAPRKKKEVKSKDDQEIIEVSQADTASSEATIQESVDKQNDGSATEIDPEEDPAVAEDILILSQDSAIEDQEAGSIEKPVYEEQSGEKPAIGSIPDEDKPAAEISPEIATDEREKEGGTEAEEITESTGTAEVVTAIAKTDIPAGENAMAVMEVEEKEEAISPEEISVSSESELPESISTESDDEAQAQNEEVKEKEISATGESAETEAKTSEKISSEKEIPTEEKPVDEKKTTDYSTLSEVELVNAFRALIESNTNEDIQEEVEAIKTAFYRKHKARIEEQRKDFVLAGGNIEEFKPEENLYENDIRDLLQAYRSQRVEFNRKQEDEKEENYQKKIDIIEELKGLINTEESINKTFIEFRDIQRRWHEIGLVPQSKMKDLWETYHFHIENFYDYIKINKELRDLDLRKNLEIKIELCEKAEELLVEPSIIKAFNQLQKYHERWREIGPVPSDKKDEIWERFKAATTKINKRHQEFFEKRKQEQKKNLEAKNALCEKAEEYAAIDPDANIDWDKTSREVIKLQKLWRTIGFAPHRDNNRIYERFRKACDIFFERRREFFSKNKELQQNNLQLKIDLCIQAEALRENDDWKKTTQEFIELQKKWKEIGPVPRKQSDSVWKRFRAACDYFFDRKAEHFSSIDSEQIKNLQDKNQLIEDVRNFKFSGIVEEDLKTLKDYQRQWTEIGHVPIRYKNEIQKQFRETINKHFDELNIENGQRNKLKFRSKMSNLSETNRGINKMRFEREKYVIKLKQLESDLTLLDNNIGFFSQSKNAMSLIADVNRKIEQTKDKIAYLKEKIRIIDEFDESEE